MLKTKQVNYKRKKYMESINNDNMGLYTIYPKVLIFFICSHDTNPLEMYSLQKQCICCSYRLSERK